jgi:hypothetical protein
MSLVNIILAIIVVGFLLWALNQFVPMDPKVQRILNAVAIIGLILWLLQVLGVLDPILNIRVG